MGLTVLTRGAVRVTEPAGRCSAHNPPTVPPAWTVAASSCSFRRPPPAAGLPPGSGRP